MTYGIGDLVSAFLLGLVLGACAVALVVVDARQNALERDLQPVNAAHVTRGVVLDQWDLRVIRQQLSSTCALRAFEDGSAVWERDDDERHMCREVVSQIGR